MAKPLLFAKGGKTYGPHGKAAAGVDVQAAPFTAELTKSGIAVSASEPGFWKPKSTQTHEFTFAGSKFERVDSSRSGGKAAAGAIAGGLLLGPLGLIAGAALGSGKAHVVAARDGETSLVVELKTDELQVLIARGALT